MSTNCSECGAKLCEGASVCDLCGSPVPGNMPSQPEINDDESGAREASESVAEPAPIPDEHIFCNECGWQNPVGSNFCSSCGSTLQRLAPTAVRSASSRRRAGPGPKNPVAGSAGENSDRLSVAPSGSDGTSSVARQTGIIIGAAVLIVVALYMMSTMGSSSSSASNGQTMAAIPQEGPLREPTASQAAVLQEELSGLIGDDKIEKQRGLIRLYISASRFDLAGAEAEQVAEFVNTERAWIDAGNLYYDWMDTRLIEQKAEWSVKAVNAYRQALEINPENLDVRTDLSIALMFHPQESMMAIRENMRVLELDSTHVQANFNRGIMLLQINRVDKARAQFEKVMTLVNDPDDPIYQRARDAIARITFLDPGA